MKVETMFYVVSKATAAAMAGSRSARQAGRMTIYGMFRSPENAESYRITRWGNSRHLVSAIVEQ